MPRNVSLCGADAGAALGPCLGPHTVEAFSPGALDVQESCSAAVRALALEALSLGTVFKAPTRTYDEGPYAARDAFCPVILLCVPVPLLVTPARLCCRARSTCLLSRSAGRGARCWVPCDPPCRRRARLG